MHKNMHTKVQKWGNSLGIRLPMPLAKQLHLHPGSSVLVDVEDGRIVIQAPQYHLESMLKEITSKNRHHQILEDQQKGNEEW